MKLVFEDQESGLFYHCIPYWNPHFDLQGASLPMNDHRFQGPAPLLKAELPQRFGCSGSRREGGAQGAQSCQEEAKAFVSNPRRSDKSWIQDEYRQDFPRLKKGFGKSLVIR